MASVGSSSPVTPAVSAVSLSQRTSGISLTHKLVVGATAGIFGTSLIYPLDILKTKLQTNTQRFSWRMFSSTAVGLVRHGSLYRGFSACLVGIAPEKAIKLTVNDVMRDIYTCQGARQIQMHQEVFSGSMAGLLQLAVTVPYESVKIKLQMQPEGAKANMVTVLKNMGGLPGLYRGLTATAWRDVPFCFIFFPLYSQVKALQMRYIYGQDQAGEKVLLHLPHQPEPFHVGLVAGIISGAVAAVAVTPADLLKTRIQSGQSPDLFAADGRRLGFFEYAKVVVRKEGASALFKGWHTRMLVIAPLYGIVSLAFEIQKTWLSR